MALKKTALRAAASSAALGMMVSLAVPALAADYWIGDGDITVRVDEDGNHYVTQVDHAGNVKYEDVLDETGVTINGGSSQADNRFGVPEYENDGLDDFGFFVDSEEDFLEDDLFEVEPEEEPDAPEEADREPAAEENGKETSDGNPVDYLIKIISRAVGDLAAKITLSDVNIAAGYKKSAMKIEGEGNVELELNGNNKLVCAHPFGGAGIEKDDRDSSGTLTIRDADNDGGSLIATGAAESAGIGGAFNGGASNIVIESGTILATGGHNGAGIGGGRLGEGSNITISGGSVTANGGTGGAGIGGGVTGDGSNITISGGTVTANGGGGAAGIGGGAGNAGDTIAIRGGDVTAVGGIGGAGIGGGVYGAGSGITVSGDAGVTAEAGKGGTLMNAAISYNYGAGASIGNGTTNTGATGAGGAGTADIDDLYTTGHIYHIAADGTQTDEIGQKEPPVEEPEQPEVPEQPETPAQPELPEVPEAPEAPDTPAESLENAVQAELPLYVEGVLGNELEHTVEQNGSVVTLTTDNSFARLHGSLLTLRTMQEQGVDTLVFVTTHQKTHFSLDEICAQGDDETEFSLCHDADAFLLEIGLQVMNALCRQDWAE